MSIQKHLTQAGAKLYNVCVRFKYLKQLEKALKTLEYHQPLFKLLKRELDNLHYWRNRPRGNPSKGYRIMKEKTIKPD